MARKEDTVNDYQTAITIFASMVEKCFPYAFTFAFGSLLVRSALRMMFGGKVEFK